jgi:hypothetical protein
VAGRSNKSQETGLWVSQSYEKLKTLLKDPFQLDRPELDFERYRATRTKSAEPEVAVANMATSSGGPE